MDLYHEPKPPFIERFAAFLFLVMVWFILMVMAASCSGSRKVVKSLSSVDSTVTLKTNVSIDSSARVSKQTHIIEHTDNDVKTTDDYTETTTTKTTYDSTGKVTSKEEKKEKKGITTTKDNTKKKTELNAKEDNQTKLQSNKKEESTAQIKKEESNKAVDSKHSVLSGSSILMLCLGLILFAAIIFFVWRWVKHKKTF